MPVELRSINKLSSAAGKGVLNVPGGMVDPTVLPVIFAVLELRLYPFVAIRLGCKLASSGICCHCVSVRLSVYYKSEFYQQS